MTSAPQSAPRFSGKVFNNTASNNWTGTGSLNSWATIGAGNVRQAVSTSNHTVPISITLAATNGTTTVTCASTAKSSGPGMLITGPNIPGSINGTATGNTTIASITNATTFELSQAASGTASGLTLTAVGVTLSNCTTVAGTGVTCDNTAGLVIGMALSGTGLANDATVATVASATTFTTERRAHDTGHGADDHRIGSRRGIQWRHREPDGHHVHHRQRHQHEWDSGLCRILGANPGSCRDEQLPVGDASLLR